jgi:tape measure domain-containing protein
MATSNISIQVSQTGARQVSVAMAGVGAAAEKSAGQVDLMNKALELLGAALAIDQVKKWADAWSQAAGLIGVATKSTSDQVEVMNRLYDVAQKTRSGFTDIVELYSRAARAGSDLGASQEQVIQFTEGIGKALVVQHTSAEQASGSLLQLGQLLGTGKVRAQEFNSVNENLTTVLKIVAQNIDGAGGSVAKLRQIMAGSGLTSKQFFDAFLKGGATLDAEFNKSGKTIAQALTVVNNAITRYVGQLNEAIGGSDELTKAANFLATNMNKLASAVLAVGVAVAVAFAPAAIEAFIAAMVRLLALMNANPFIAVASALAAFATYVALVGDKMDAGIDGITTYKDLLQAVGEIGASAFQSLLDGANEVFGMLTGSTFPSFFDDTKKGFAGLIQSIARTFDSIGGIILGAYVFVGRAVGGIPDLFKSAFQQGYNAVASIIEDMVNTVIEGVNKLRSSIGNTTMIDPIKIAKLEVDQDAYKKYGEGLADSINEGFKIQGQMLENSVLGVFDRARQISIEKGRQAFHESEHKDLPNLNQKMGPGNTGTDPEALKHAENAWRSLLNAINPVEGALEDIKKAQLVVNDAVKVGITDQLGATEVMKEVKDHYDDIIHPVGAFIKQLDLQKQGLSGNIQSVDEYSQALAFADDQRKKSNNLSQDTIQYITDELVARNRLARVIGQEQNILAASVNARRDYSEQLEAINKLLADPSSGFTQADKNDTLVKMQPELMQGTQAFVEANVRQYKEMYQHIDDMRKADLIDEQTADQLRIQQSELLKQKYIEMVTQAAQARLSLGTGDWADATIVQLNRLQGSFTNMLDGANVALTDFLASFEDGFSSAVGNAVVYSDDLGQSMIKLAKDITSQLIGALVKLGIQWLAHQALTSAASEATLASTTVASAAAAASTATAWAPAAALVNAATYGAGAAAGAIGLEAIFAASEGIAAASLGGFEEGGYTGNGPTDAVAGLVHGREFVVNAEGTQKNRALLEAMNRGQRVVTAAAAPQRQQSGVQISVQNNGTPQNYQVEQLSATQVKLIAEDAVARKAPQVIAQDLGNPNSATSKSFRQNTLTPRRRSV